MSKKTRVLNLSTMDDTQLINFFYLCGIISNKQRFSGLDKFELSLLKTQYKRKVVNAQATSIDSLILNGSNGV